MKKVVLWDFDGTLVAFTSWRYAIMDVLDEFEPGHKIDSEQVRPFLRNGFPWHRPDEPHHHLAGPDAWWQALEPLFASAYQGVGFDRERAAELAGQVRRYMVQPQRYALFEDTLPVLVGLQEKGWRHIILSNHMPELPAVVTGLGLSRYLDGCITSAVTGYEKPNPKAFANALTVAGNPEVVWMVGDNLISDVKGAEAAGIPAILVRNPPEGEVRFTAGDLSEAAKIITDTPV
jgi:putative hydrolase of the HAD superfamily